MSPRPTYVEFADAILSTPGGAQMIEALAERFPAISRADTIYGIALAWAIRDADLIHADREIRMLQQELGLGRAA